VPPEGSAVERPIVQAENRHGLNGYITVRPPAPP
jgi:hypothetical protein